MNARHYLACDLGAESGRVMLGSLDGGKLTIEEIHRFPNQPVAMAGSIRWDILGIFRELKAGLRKAAARGLPIASVSVDSWGVDYVWSGAGQPMLAPPFIYRDARTDAAYEAALRRVSRERIFSRTGIQFMPINTIYQLFSDATHSPRLLEIADQFLCIADYFHFLFCGVARVEESLASTTQLYDPRARNWSVELIDALDIPRHVFPEIVPSGTRLGRLAEEIAGETGLDRIDVVATCSHDTGAAVAAVPATLGAGWAFLSSGTWSLIGVELAEPLINEDVLAAGFTNEAGYGATTRFLKNLAGLWILQECRRQWERAGTAHDYAALMELASGAEPLRSLIDPEDPRFLKSGDMPAKVAAFCEETGQKPPRTPGEFTRCILESLAILYRISLERIESLTGRSIRKLHIVGGGSQSALLNQFAANATGRTVIAGPVEASTIGNVLIQALVAGQLDSVDALRACVRDSFPVASFEPAERPAWDAAHARLATIRAGR